MKSNKKSQNMKSYKAKSGSDNKKHINHDPQAESSRAVFGKDQ